jgi:RNA polymerase sigma factor (sigma-70 family)
MTDKKKEDEIKRALIADAANPDAWERVAVVPPSSSPRPVWYGKSRGLATRRPIADPKDEDARSKRQAPMHPPVDHASREAEALRRKQLHDAIADLPEGQRHAIQLWLDGFHYTDIAHVLGISVAAVKSRLRDAKRHLRPTLDVGDHRNDHRSGRVEGRQR